MVEHTLNGALNRAAPSRGLQYLRNKDICRCAACCNSSSAHCNVEQKLQLTCKRQTHKQACIYLL